MSALSAWPWRRRYRGPGGHVKRWMEEQDESGFRTDRYFDDVCEHCIGDPALALFVSRCGPILQCDFCSRTDVLGIGVGDLFHYMAGCIAAEWDDPINEVGWERGWDPSVRVYGSDELLGLADEPLENKDLYWEFVSAFQHDWCQRSPYRLEHAEMLLHSWARFAEVTKKRTRFLFERKPAGAGSSGDDLLDPAEVLEAIGTAITNADWRMVGKTTDVQIFRARAHPVSEDHTSRVALGTPPATRAGNNRMSPAGIPMFYGAESAETAIAEIRPQRADAVTIGEWSPARELVYLDLMGARPIPSIFDMSARRDRTWLRFLASFADDLAVPVTEEDAFLEYVPIQIITEDIRDHLRAPDGRAFDAIRYQSAADAVGGVCWVVFAEQQDCGPGPPEPVLVLNQRTVARLAPSAHG